MSGRDGHAGDLLAALVDGHLPERERQRVLDHLAACRSCLSDYDAQLALKGLLRDLPDPGAPDDLRDRLARLPAAPAVEDRHGGRPMGRRDAPGPAGRRVPRPRPRSRRAKVGATLLTVSAMTLTAAYVLGGAAEGTAVVPPADQYVREHTAVSVSVPFTQPVPTQLVVQPVPYVLPMSQPAVQPAVPGIAVPGSAVGR